MAETVQYYMEQMVPELEELQQKGIFTATEIKSIVQKRRDFEYALKRRPAKKADFLRYIEYELNLEQLRKCRRDKLQRAQNASGARTATRKSQSEYAGVRRIFFLFDRLSRKFHGDVQVWMEYARFAVQQKSSKAAGRIFARAVQYHPRCAELWMMAASWEWEENGSVTAARTLLQRALRLNADVEDLWLHYFHLEVLYLVQILERRRRLGIPVVGTGTGTGTREEQEPPMAESFLSGAVPLAVYRNAIQQLPKSVNVFSEFWNAYHALGKRFEILATICQEGCTQVEQDAKNAFPDLDIQFHDAAEVESSSDTSASDSPEN